MRNATDTVFRLSLELATDSLANIVHRDFQYKRSCPLKCSGVTISDLSSSVDGEGI
jgi:hypothetical protein